MTFNYKQPAQQEPTVVCEVCGTVKLLREAHSFIIVGATHGLVPHEDGSIQAYPGYQCDQIQHWGCNEDHARQLAHACIEQCMQVKAKRIREEMPIRRKVEIDHVNKFN